MRVLLEHLPRPPGAAAAIAEGLAVGVGRGGQEHAWAGGGVLDREEACEQIHEYAALREHIAAASKNCVGACASGACTQEAAVNDEGKP